MIKSSKIFLLITIIFVALLAPSVFAQEPTNTTSTTSDETSSEISPTPRSLRPQAIKKRIQNAQERNQEIRDNIKERASKAAERRQEKLSQARLKVCKARAKAIGNRLKAMHKRATLIHKGHEKTYAKVDEFYNKRLVPNGYSLSNYADLKAEIEANKANVQTLLEAATKTGTDFDCSSEDPKGQVDAFKEDMKALIDANKTYKESIHTFVKAVRDLAKTAKLDKLSTTPIPTEEGAGE